MTNTTEETTTAVVEVEATPLPPRRSNSADPGAWGVAVALTVLLVMMLCLVILYSKARRRRAALRGQRNSIRAIAGGVPMGVGAYSNFSPRLQEYLREGRHNTQTAPQYTEQPPSYEDAIQQTQPPYISGVINMAFCNENQEVIDPPPYSPNLNGSSSQPQQQTEGSCTLLQLASTSSSSPNHSNKENRKKSEPASVTDATNKTVDSVPTSPTPSTHTSPTPSTHTSPTPSSHHSSSRQPNQNGNQMQDGELPASEQPAASSGTYPAEQSHSSFHETANLHPEEPVDTDRHPAPNNH